MKGGRGQVICEGEQMCCGEQGLTLCGGVMILFCPCQCAIDESRFVVQTYIGEVELKLVACPREVGVYRFWVDIETLKVVA